MSLGIPNRHPRFARACGLGSKALEAALIAAGIFASSAAWADLPSKQECVATNEEAQHLKRTHQWVEAKKRLLGCVAPSCPGPIREDCLDMLSEIQRAMPTVVFMPKDPSGADVKAVAVAVDGVRLAAQIDATPIEVDPGDHAFSFESEGYVWATQTVRIKPWERNRPIRMVLRPLAAPSPRPEPEPETGVMGPPEPRAAPAATQLPVADASDEGTAGKRRAAFLVLGVGAAGVAVGTVFGLAALQRQFLIDSDCPKGRCAASVLGEMGARNTDALACDVSLAVGVLALGIGGVLLFFSHDRGAVTAPAAGVVATPWIGLDAVGVRGSFR